MREIKDKYDIIIAGAGVAGLNTALFLPRNKEILLLAKETPLHSDSYLAQGGICVLKWDGDYDTYYEDTMRAGHYENTPETVDCMLRCSREIISDLIGIGVDFTRDEYGNLLYTREGGHHGKRILYHEDCTGKEITSKLYRKVSKLKNVHIRPYTALLDILEDGEQCTGAVIRCGDTGEIKTVISDYVVLATGGIGGLYKYSTNFRNLTGDGLAICLKHGVEMKDVDYVQIHPTTLYTKKGGRRFLISESVRGEGAQLLNSKGERFVDELLPRDIVSEAIFKEMKKEKTDFVYLDMRTIPQNMLNEHFPAIVKKCIEEGYDPFNEPVPVVPGQHYFMGGIKSDLDGRTSMKRLFAVGETCCNGVHGKNRLASNSLLESLIFAKRAALRIKNTYKTIPNENIEKSLLDFDSKKYSNLKELKNEYKNLIKKESVRSAEARKLI